MSDVVETVKVKPWAKDQGDFVEINAHDFDPKVHQKHEDGAKASKAAAKPAEQPKSELSVLRAEYKEAFGKNPSPSLKADALRAKIDEHKAAEAAKGADNA